jgi:hypothetical protein
MPDKALRLRSSEIGASTCNAFGGVTPGVDHREDFAVEYATAATLIRIARSRTGAIWSTGGHYSLGVSSS